jgi:hypothetical protein
MNSSESTSATAAITPAAGPARRAPRRYAIAKASSPPARATSSHSCGAASSPASANTIVNSTGSGFHDGPCEVTRSHSVISRPHMIQAHGS